MYILWKEVTKRVETLTIEDSFVRILNLFEGVTMKERMKNSFKEALMSKLRVRNDEITALEAKYGMSFSEFQRAWDKDQIADKYSYEVEGDYIDWEALEMDKRKLLNALAEVRELDNE